ncbi:MAG: ABC transporter permease [Calditrichaeota bacterium]|nr:ABC transporter permease [Calditrichota bacterium]
MKLWYPIREGFSNLKRSRSSVWVSVLTISLSLWLVGLFLMGAWNGWQFLQNLRDKLELEVFLVDTVQTQEAYDLRKIILNIPGVDSVQFISKYAAMKKFEKEFGENIEAILGENPLPASFKIRLKKSYHSKKNVQKIIGQIKKLPGIEDVSYRYDLLKIIEKYLKLFFGGGVFLGIMIGFLSILLIANTVRMAIISRREEIQIMRLIGATPAFIRRPFLVQGFLLGLFGGVLSVLFLGLVVWIVRQWLAITLVNEKEIWAFILVWGIVLGMIGSWRAIRLYLKEKI